MAKGDGKLRATCGGEGEGAGSQSGREGEEDSEGYFRLTLPAEGIFHDMD